MQVTPGVLGEGQCRDGGAGGISLSGDVNGSFIDKINNEAAQSL